ncbi:hypothetical protein B0J17DRAFT_231009 [Rhizoctonia solani]|nr:hypothetical protein B0J17DRAFT_231009 [Rhizoctonia solani]
MSLIAGALSQGNPLKKSAMNRSLDAFTTLNLGNPTTPIDTVANKDEDVALSQPYRLLLDNEPDVLLVLCSLIYDRPKVVCYFTCGSHVLKLYKSLELTQSSLTRIANRQLTYVVSNSSKSLDLFFCYRRPMCRVATSKAHRLYRYSLRVARQLVPIHHSSTNLLVACSGDKDLYASGSTIISQTVVWPGDTGGFRASVDILRPLFEEKLSELSFEMKEEAYIDWIHLHSGDGPRSVSSWTPSALAKRANQFILGSLAYKSPGSMVQTPTLQTPLAELLPEVTAEFVKKHGLQPAVDQGLLRMETEVQGEDTHGPGIGAVSAHQPFP